MSDIVFNMAKNLSMENRNPPKQKHNGLTYRSIVLQKSSLINLCTGASFDVSWLSNFQT